MIRLSLDETKRKIRNDLPPDVSDETSDAVAQVIWNAGHRLDWEALASEAVHKEET